MPGQGGTQNHNKRTNKTFSRLHLIGKNIMDSLGVLSKQNRSPESVQRSNTMPKNHCHNGSTNLKHEDPYKTSTWAPDRRNKKCHRTDFIRKANDFRENQEATSPSLNLNIASSETAYQTWPYDTFSVCPTNDHQCSDFQSSAVLVIDTSVIGAPEKTSCTPPISDLKEQNVGDCSVDQFKEPENGCQKIIKDSPETGNYTSPISHLHEQSSGNSSVYHAREPDNSSQNVKHQEVQTDPEPLEPKDIVGVNDDIIQYLNQFHDTTVPNVHACNQLQYPGSFSPCYDLYEERHYNRHHGQRDFFFQSRENHHGQEEYASYCGRGFHGNERAQAAYTTPKCMKVQRHKYAEQFQYVASNTTETIDWPFRNDRHFLTQPFPHRRVSSDGSASVFSSETDSDFVFYPCTSLAQTFQNMSMTEPRDPSYLSPPTDMPENINMNFSWKSDFYGSSLDDITVQFFLDEDALSDDVFIDDLEENGQGKTSGISKQRAEIDASCGHGLNEPSSLMMTDTLGLRNSICEEYYTYRYADIDEVLQNCRDKSPNDYQPSHSPQIKQDVHEKEPRKESSRKSTSSENSPRRNTDEASPSAKYDFSYVFDSLRRNSTQTKARNMWRQRRVKGKKGNKENATVDRDVSELSKRHKSPPTQQQNLVFTFDQVNVPSYSRNAKAPPKSLRGILKNKDRKPLQKQDGRESPDKTKPFHNASPSRTAISNNNIEGNANWPQKVNTEVGYPPASSATGVPTMEVHSPKITMSLSDNTVFSHTNIGPEAPAIHLDTCHEEAIPRAKEKIPIIRQCDTGIDCKKTPSPQADQNTESCQNETETKPLLTGGPIDQFHFFISPSNSGTSEVISVRKNSLEIYKWTLSLQRRRRRQTKKARVCARREPQNGDCLSPCHNIRAIPATL